MTVRSTLALVLSLASPAPLFAQHTGAGGAPSSTAAPKEAAQFDFLIGEWSLEVRPKVSGLAAKIHGVPKLTGSWKAWRAFDGWGIEDELRVVNAGGTTQTLTQAMRVFDPGANHWITTTVDPYRARITAGSAEWSNGTMTYTSQAKDQDGKPYISRGRYSSITATTFKFVQDRSYDDGKTWDEPTLTILAKRVAASAAR